MPIFLLTESLHDRFNEQKPIKRGGDQKAAQGPAPPQPPVPPAALPTPPPPPPPAPPAPRALGLSATLPIVLIYWESRRRSAAATRLPRGDPSWEAGATAHPGLLGTSLDSGSGAALPHPPQQGPQHSSGTRTGKTDFNNGSQKVLLKTVGVPWPGRCLTRHGHQAVPLVQLVPPPGTWRL